LREKEKEREREREMLGTTFGKFSSTLSINVTVINIGTLETSKSQQLVTVFNGEMM
jgi:hypothetical protein